MHQTEKDLVRIYRRRFADTAAYRWQVWSVLTKQFFQRWIPTDATVLDLGCGYGEFINQIKASRKLAMDLNPDVPKYLDDNVEFIRQDCSARWSVPSDSLDIVFTSNFFEHLLDKPHLTQTLHQVVRCLKPGGRLIAMGPNIRYLPGIYWDFYDHHIILTEASLGEAMEMAGFEIAYVKARFLPYTIVNVRRYPLWMVRLYLALPWLWRIKGRQFLIVGRKPDERKDPA